MASRRSHTSAEIESIAADAVQQALMAMEVEETSLAVVRNKKNEFNMRCSLSFYRSVMQDLHFRSAHLKTMRNSPFHAYVKCEMVTYPISFIVDLMRRFDGEERFKIGPWSLPFRPSNLATVMGIPNIGSPINLNADGTKASLRRILGSKKTMDRHNVHLKLKEYVPQEGELAVEISVKLWFALLCSCFFFPTSGTSGLMSILPYLDDLHEMKNANWAAAIHEYLISGVKAFGAAAGSSKTIFLTGCVLTLGAWFLMHQLRWKPDHPEIDPPFFRWDCRGKGPELSALLRGLRRSDRKKKKQEEDQRKKKEEKEAKRKRNEEQRKKKEEEEVKRKRNEEQRKKKEQEEDQRKKKDEEEAEKKKKEEEEEERKRMRRQISPSSLSRRVSAEMRIRRQPELYTPDDFRHHKATKVNVSTSEPIIVDSQESTDTLPRGKKEERRDYVAREALGVAEKSLIERFLNECIINEEFMFHGTVEGYDNFLSFHDIRELLFARESESVIIDCYINAYLFLPREENPDLFWNFGYVGAALMGYVKSCTDDKSKEQHFEYAFGKLDRAPNEFDLIFSPMHVGTNHWALLVIHNKEKEFHVYDSLRNKHRPDIPQYVEELKSYLKGKHIDADKWPLHYPDPCPQQGSGDDCGIFTCKYMECLARRDIQDLPFQSG
ncbi:hypothetical protein Taro_007143 [Colocasia esculenta]|uniref:Ubiquitin-like protease family profile domain-containing protein n=1 Tax=Colocasia esculenta TaxID=4460 RepID=A0A843TY38_COLES|nr:hypothetical protein [Colocasia esculenta]